MGVGKEEGSTGGRRAYGSTRGSTSVRERFIFRGLFHRLCKQEPSDDRQAGSSGCTIAQEQEFGRAPGPASAADFLAHVDDISPGPHPATSLGTFHVWRVL